MSRVRVLVHPRSKKVHLEDIYQFENTTFTHCGLFIENDWPVDDNGLFSQVTCGTCQKANPSVVKRGA
jgi:hypothetical protein